MTREIKDAEISYVSYVDRPANGRKFFLTKAENDKDEEITPQELQELIQNELKPIMNRVNNLEKSRTQKSIWSNLFKAEGYRFKK